LTLLDLQPNLNYLETGPLDPTIYLQQSLISGMIAGILGGSGIVFLWEKWLRSKPYGKALLSIFLSYIFIYLIVLMSSGVIFQIHNLKGSILDIQVWLITLNTVFEPSSIFSFMTWLVIVIATLIVLLVNDKYGPGVFKKFLLGKYFLPQREERVFMFLDLRSSTTIAEKIGETRYFNFLKDVFRLATDGILKYQGEIYQYVGDEIVVSWELQDGINNENCINCFFEIQSKLLKNKAFFLGKYGEVPVFKAGLHYGYVMAGEIGVVKRDIAYSGDVLNTTARIQGKCNEMGVDILVSKPLIDKMDRKGKIHTAKEMGEIQLRGKQELVALLTV
jgi:adenylate cyclase